MRAALSVLLLFVAFADRLPVEAQAPAPSAGRFSLDSFSAVRRVAEPQFSPDGSSIAFIVATPNLDENRHVASLYRVDVAGGAPTLLVDGATQTSVSFPRWSPDGARLAFLANAMVNGASKLQVFTMPSGGGAPVRLTMAATGVQQFAWSPDGRTIAFAAADEPETRAGWQRWNQSFEVQPNYHLFMEAPVPPTHVWMVPSDGTGPSKRLTSGAWTLPVARPPGPPSSLITWTPDGREVVFARTGGGGARGGGGGPGGGGLQAVNIADGTMRSVGGNGTFPVYSPKGDQIAMIGGNNASVVPAAGGQVRNLTQAIDRGIVRALWMADGQSLVVGGNDTERVSLWLQPVAGGDAKRLDTGGASPNSSYFVDVATSSRGAIAFAGTRPDRPAEIYYMATPDAPPRRLTDFNAGIAALPLGKTEMLSYRFEDYDQNGVLTYPPDFDPAKKYPLVLVIHGGPRAASLLTFNPRAQLMAARGWLVFEPNYRGSDNLGRRFQGAISNDAGAGPGRDVMAGIDVIKQKGIVDETRMGVSGWSYGGYMTTWMLGNYPDVWKAGVAGAAVTDRIDQASFSDGAGRGNFWLNAEVMARELAQSPITYAKHIKAPTLILANTGDYRVPITQSYKLYHALRAAGITTRFVAYPIPLHNAPDPVHQRDTIERWVGWFEEHFGR